ncbi:MAG TPA: maleylpyruvate isomerase N-terminal domain-containing protein [Jiangellales bacterium]|nr:maleylpyruvate isomerase N-terminal domain-containing protein [Jiangellales bacterium]
MHRDRHAAAFMAAVQESWELASAPQVREAWQQESACAGMTVGGLTHHLLGQARSASQLLDAPPGEDQPIALLEHYSRAAWVQPEAEVNASIRDSDNAAAEQGADAVLGEAQAAIETLPGLLARPRDPDTVHIPWQGWSLTTPDFLTTRMMEMVVHGDDLAASVGLPTPTYPDDVVGPVLALLTAVAVRRHGQTALVRALARPQRAPGTVSAF